MANQITHKITKIEDGAYNLEIFRNSDLIWQRIFRTADQAKNAAKTEIEDIISFDANFFSKALGMGR